MTTRFMVVPAMLLMLIAAGCAKRPATSMASAPAPGGAASLSSATGSAPGGGSVSNTSSPSGRSEEHTSELQSRLHLVCRLLLEKKKKKPTAKLRDQPIRQALLVPFRLEIQGAEPPPAVVLAFLERLRAEEDTALRRPHVLRRAV